MIIYLVETEYIANDKYEKFKSAHYSKENAERALEILKPLPNNGNVELIYAEISELTLQ